MLPFEIHLFQKSVLSKQSGYLLFMHLLTMNNSELNKALVKLLF